MRADALCKRGVGGDQESEMARACDRSELRGDRATVRSAEVAIDDCGAGREEPRYGDWIRRALGIGEEIERRNIRCACGLVEPARDGG